MKFTFIQDFTLEVGDKTLTGTFKELSKSETKAHKAKQDELLKLSKETRKYSSRLTFLQQKKEIKEKLEDWAEVDKIFEEMQELTDKLNEAIEVLSDSEQEENIYKSRLDMSLGGDFISEIMELGHEYGYKRVFDTIQKDIQDKEGND